MASSTIPSFPEILRHTLYATELAPLYHKAGIHGHILDAVLLTDGKARLYLSKDTGTLLLSTDAEAGAISTRLVSGAPMIDLQLDADGRVSLSLNGCVTRVTPRADDQGLLEGRDVLLGHCNHESPEVMRDWLIWHVRHHGATGVLILDRAPPGSADDRADALRRLLVAAIEAEPSLEALLAPVRIVVVQFDIPLGAADHGPESHSFYAPDAPGKDRMEKPEPAPWQAQLDYPLIYDLLRQRYLARAGAVANIELFDLIRPLSADEGTIFDLARNNSLGLVPLLGERVYPWGLRPGEEPAFSDHICRRFDADPRDWRWCAVPEKLPDGVIWMVRRILGARTNTPSRPFWRFMALRHGGDDPSKVGQVVPKTSLIEDADLLSLSAELGGNPKRQPLAEPVPDTQRQRSDRVAIVTTMKNEGPFILEWLAYHRAIGVEDFLVYTNDCTDGTDELLQLLEKKGYVQWRDNPYRDVNMKPQHAALDAANDEPIMQNAGWAICMDVDEYIAIHTGDGTLKALFEAVPDANMISCTWRLFGNCDVDEYKDEFITQIFTRAAREFTNKPHQAWGFKTLYRNEGLFKKLGVHRPKGLNPQMVDRINWVNGSGKPIPKDQWRTAWRSHSGTYGYDLVALNHYAVRSAESFLVKRDRGRVNHVDRDQGMAYWFRMNHNVIEDRRMENILPILQAEYDRIIQDPEIAQMHNRCVRAHRAKIDELKAQPNYQAFHAELNSARMRKLSRLHGHFGSNIYLAGPEAIPPEIVARDPDESFFFTIDHIGETQH